MKILMHFDVYVSKTDTTLKRGEVYDISDEGGWRELIESGMAELAAKATK